MLTDIFNAWYCWQWLRCDIIAFAFQYILNTIIKFTLVHLCKATHCLQVGTFYALVKHPPYQHLKHLIFEHSFTQDSCSIIFSNHANLLLHITETQHREANRIAHCSVQSFCKHQSCGTASQPRITAGTGTLSQHFVKGKVHGRYKLQSIFITLHTQMD